jgi:hypothetical protein
MSLSAKFNKAKITTMALAKVGNPLRDEPLQTSKALCKLETEEDIDLLTTCFLKPFKALDFHHFHHHTSLDQNEMYSYVTAIFEDPSTLLTMGEKVARHLYEKSRHPNIKSGDLCTTFVEKVLIDGEETQAVCIIKSESKVPFLQISIDDGDLRLKTQRGIYPDKIDKGALIIKHLKEEGYLVYMFDKGGNAHFWNRDFLNVVPRQDDNYLTKKYAEMCVAFAAEGLPEEVQEEERLDIANKTITYLGDKEDFDLDEFREYALKDADVIEKFDAFKASYEEEKGEVLEEKFKLAKPVADKARKRLKGKIKTDTGAQVYFTSRFIDNAGEFLQRGFDDKKGMNFLKIFYNSEDE